MSKLHLWVRILGVCAVGAQAASVLPAQTLNVLYSFQNAQASQSPLVQATDGNLYGTTAAGGVHGDGTILRVTPGGAVTALYSFCSQTACADGQSPFGGLIQASNGNLMGTTERGGQYSIGTVFEITTAGVLTVLHSFNGADGYYPLAPLVQASDGNLYGTTSVGGMYDNGTVFQMTAGGALTTLHDFCVQSGCADGAGPSAGLIEGAAGVLFGTTTFGGVQGRGTVFKIATSGPLKTLYSFCSQTGCADGDVPYSGLVQAANGNFYGTTSAGGADNDGAVFTLNADGALSTLYSFTGGVDGSIPYASLELASDGSFYGTTYFGGANGVGAIYQITPGGALSALYSFCSDAGCVDGDIPYAGLVQDTNGNFYGTTFLGGANNDGTIYCLWAGLAPYVETQSLTGAVGTSINILGTNLTGATGVTFNGTPAEFQVVSASEIIATVPAGATTGLVQVTIPGASLNSKVSFRISPPEARRLR